jgi:hypothetical protein
MVVPPLGRRPRRKYFYVVVVLEKIARKKIRSGFFLMCRIKPQGGNIFGEPLWQESGRWVLRPHIFGTLSNIKGAHLGTLSDIKHKVNLIIWRDSEVMILVGGLDLMPIRSFPIANNRPKTPPPSPFLGGRVLIFFWTFVRLV